MTPADLNAARKQLGLTQAQLAAELGVHQSTYAKWEAGTFNIRHPGLLNLALESLAIRAVAKAMLEAEKDKKDT